jgi:hypothetical protein
MADKAPLAKTMENASRLSKGEVLNDIAVPWVD